MTSPRRRRPRPRWLIVHATVVVVLAATFQLLVAMTSPEDGANIGAGLVALPLIFPLGLPWSLPALIDPYRFDGAPPALWALVFLGPAVLNVFLHGVALWMVRGRRREPPESVQGTAQG